MPCMLHFSLFAAVFMDKVWYFEENNRENVASCCFLKKICCIFIFTNFLWFCELVSHSVFFGLFVLFDRYFPCLLE